MGFTTLFDVWRQMHRNDPKELVSREDPLYEILQSTVYDAVLERAELILGGVNDGVKM
jgi:hypothetical protein